MVTQLIDILFLTSSYRSSRHLGRFCGRFWGKKGRKSLLIDDFNPFFTLSNPFLTVFGAFYVVMEKRMGFVRVQTVVFGVSPTTKTRQGVISSVPPTRKTRLNGINLDIPGIIGDARNHCDARSHDENHNSEKSQIHVSPHNLDVSPRVNRGKSVWNATKAKKPCFVEKNRYR